MKKALVIVLILILAITMFSCGKKNAGVGLPNPRVEYSSLDEINGIVGCELHKPPVMGVSDISYVVIGGDLAEYTFDVAGSEYIFRASKDLKSDISGVYIGGKEAFKGKAKKDVEFAEGEGYMLARYKNGECQYVLMTDSTYIDFDTFKSIAREMNM